MDDGKPKLLEQVRQQIRLRNYSIRTEAVYAEWLSAISAFIAIGILRRWGRWKSRRF